MTEQADSGYFRETERLSYRDIDGRKPKGEIRSRNSRKQDTDGTGHRGQMSAEPMSGSNPDEMDGEGAAFAKRRQLPRRKSQMASRGMEERDRIKGFHYRQVL